MKASTRNRLLGLMSGGAALSVVMPMSKEKKKARSRSDAHFKRDDKNKWDEFLNNSKRKSFVKAINSDIRADGKLKLHVDAMNRLSSGKRVAVVIGDSGRSYQIVKLRGLDRYGCTCGDWRYKRSVTSSADAKDADCKHIKKWKKENFMKKKAEIPPEVLETFFLEMYKEAGQGKYTTMLFGERAGQAAKRFGESVGNSLERLAKTKVPGISENVRLLPDKTVRTNIPWLKFDARDKNKNILLRRIQGTKKEVPIYPSREAAAKMLGNVARNPDDALLVGAVPGGTALLPVKKAVEKNLGI